MKVRYTFTVIREAEIDPTTLEAHRDWASSIAQNAGETLYGASQKEEIVRFKAEYKHAFLGWKRLVCLLLLLGLELHVCGQSLLPPRSHLVGRNKVPTRVVKGAETLVALARPIAKAPVRSALDAILPAFVYPPNAAQYRWSVQISHDLKHWTNLVGGFSFTFGSGETLRLPLQTNAMSFYRMVGVKP